MLIYVRQVIKMVEAGERLDQPDKCPVDVYAVMQRCWAYEAADRPTFGALLDTFSQDPEYINIRELVLDACISWALYLLLLKVILVIVTGDFASLAVLRRYTVMGVYYDFSKQQRCSSYNIVETI